MENQDVSIHISVKTDTHEVEEALEKAKKLKRLLEEAKSLVDDLASMGAKMSLRVEM